MNIRTALSTRPSGLLVALILGGALVLTGCQGGGDPVTEPTSTSAAPTTTATPTPTPTATYKPADASGKAQNVPVPVKPALADENSKEGLEAFTKYWYEALGYAYETGDLSYVDDVTGENCDLCNNAMKVAQGWNSDGRWIAGGSFTIPTIEIVFKEAPDGNFQALAQVIQSEMHTYQADGSEPVAPIPESNDALLLMASFSDARWSVNNLANVSN